MDFKTFCRDDLWNSNLTWNSDEPKLTRCLGQVGFNIVPNLITLFLFLFETKFIIDSQNKKIKLNSYNTIRYLISLFAIITNLKLFFNYLQEIQFSYITISFTINDLITSGFNVFIFTILTIVYHYHRLNGIITSGITFFITLLLSICSGIIYFDTILYNESMYHDFEKSSIFRTFLCSLSLFLLSLYPDNAKDIEETPLKDQTKKCPKNNSSFISKLTYFWFGKIVDQTLNNEIKSKEDVYELPESIKVEKVTKDFTDIYSKEIKCLREKGLKFNYISLLKLMWISSYKQILVLIFMDIFTELIDYTRPVVLDLLITVISDKNEPKWHCFLIITGFILILFTQVIGYNLYNTATSLLKLNLRTSCSNLIFHKALNLNSSSRKKRTTGELINLFSSDSSRFAGATVNFSFVLSFPIQLLVTCYLLHSRIGNAAFLGLGFIIFLAVLEYFFTMYKRKFYKTRSDIDDERIKLINEAVNGIKVIKFYGWEKVFHAKISDERNKQADLNKKTSNLETISNLLFESLSSLIIFTSTIAFYIFFIDSELKPQKAFLICSLFDELSYPIRSLPHRISEFFKVKVNLDRISEFLDEEELQNYVSRNHDDKLAIAVKDKAIFEWQPVPVDKKANDQNKTTDKNENSSSTEKDKPQFKLTNIEFEIQKKSFTAIIGKIGAGKSSLISAILGDMNLVENELGRKGRINISGDQDISLVAQQAWIQNDTVKNNILFGNSFNKKVYEDILDACALRPDLEQFENYDKTEIGEKGVNLSGGQKQRISLARACYSSLLKNNEKQIILLDDPLSAVDAHVGKHLCEHVLNSKTGILKGSTRLLVTNQLNQLKDLNIDQVIFLQDGEIKIFCTYDDLIRMAKEGKLKQYDLGFNINDQQENNEINEKIDDKNDEKYEEKRSSKKMNKDEEIKTGKVDFKNYYIFLQYFGILNAFCIIAFTFGENFYAFQSNNYLATWTEKSSGGLNKTDEFNEKKSHLMTYTGLSILKISSNVLTSIFMVVGILNCQKLFHQVLLLKIFRSPQKFFDKTPLGKIVSRFTEDISEIDNQLPYLIKELGGFVLEFAFALSILAYKQPNTIAWYAGIFFVYYKVMNTYNNFNRQVKRFTTGVNSPVYSHFSETLAGISTIKAFDKTDEFKKSLKSKYEVSNRCSRFSSDGSHYLTSYSNLLKNLVLLVTTFSLIENKRNLSAGEVSLIINYSLNLTSLFGVFIRYIGYFEESAVAIERIQEFCENEEEDGWEKKDIKLPEDWPKYGRIQFENYSTRYNEDTSMVLKNLNFEIEPEDKIGVVGRTGAGKTTITSALFRLIEPVEGKILIDGIDISKIGLHDLRKKISIIPQDPVLFTGTIRFNLDPFDEYSEEQIYKSLEHAHLKEFVDSLKDGLQHKIAEGGENLSVGQRQLVCLARALLRKCKILVLDEVTASVDFATDELVQKTIRSEFKNCTTITIAHRLNTVLDSTKILVLDNGSIKEYDKPDTLLKDTESSLYSFALKARVI